MLRVLTSIAIAAAHLGCAAGTDGRHRRRRQGHQDLQAQDGKRQGEDLALRRDQPCCSAEMINYYTCGSKTLGCL